MYRMYTVNPLPARLLLLLLVALAGWPIAGAQDEASVGAATEDTAANELEDSDAADQLAVASINQEQLAELPSVGGAVSPLALLFATAGGTSQSSSTAILPLAPPNHFRPKRKPQRFGESSEDSPATAGRSRFRPRNKVNKEEVAIDTEANEIPRTAVAAETVATPLSPSLPAANRVLASSNRKEFFRGDGGFKNRKAANAAASGSTVVNDVPSTEQPAKTTKLASFLRRPRPSGNNNIGGLTVAPATADLVTVTEETVPDPTDVIGSRFVEFVPTVAVIQTTTTTTTTAAPPTTTTASRFQLEDFFGTPESVAASETAPAFSPSSSAARQQVDFAAARVPVDISENLILDEVRARTVAITGAQAVGVSRESSRRDGARQLQLQSDAPNEVAAVARLREEARQGAGRRPAPAAVVKQPLVAAPRKEQALGGNPVGGGKRAGGSRPEKETVGTVERYRQEHDDGSITWGYENEDGSYKEETIGIDCITHGKYGYIDPTGEVREYSYTSGVRCDPLTRQIDAVEQQQQQTGSRGPNGHGYFDYAENKFVMADGRRVTVVVNQRNKARGTRY